MTLSTLPTGDDDHAQFFGFRPNSLVAEVVQRAHAISLSYSGGLYPPGAVGMVRWLHMVYFLRETLHSFGYEPSEHDRLSTSLNTDRRISIVVAAGNEFTGVPRWLSGRDPKTRWPKGESTVAAVQRNNQLALWDSLPEEVATEVVDKEVETWILLHFADSEQVRSELSLPSGMNGRGFVTEWTKRICLPLIDNNDGSPDEPFGDGPNFDIPVDPR